MRRPVWVYWENFKSRPEPAYITLCRLSMLHHWRDECVVFVTPENLEYYLPGMTRRVSRIEADIEGRRDRILRAFIKQRKSLAVRADVIRANLLRAFGGIYVDASSVALGTLGRYFDVLERGDRSFLISQRETHGRSDYPVGFYGCRTGSDIIEEYVAQIDALLARSCEFDYNGLGTILLSPIVRSKIDQAYVIPEAEIMPVTYERADAMYTGPADTLSLGDSASMAVFKLFNSPFSGPLARLTVEQLYRADMFIGELFRTAIPESVFQSYMSRRGAVG